MVALGEGAPDMARALVLVDIAAKLETEGVARVLGFMRAHTGGFDSLEEAVDAVAAYNPHRLRPRSTDGLRKNLRLRADGRWYWHWDPRFLDHASRTQAGEALIQQERREAAARHVKVPTLLVRGMQSDVVSAEGARPPDADSACRTDGRGAGRPHGGRRPQRRFRRGRDRLPAQQSPDGAAVITLRTADPFSLVRGQLP